MKKNTITLNINRNSVAKRMELKFSDKPTKATLNALHELNFLYRNINGELMWICTDKYLDKDGYNDFITTVCKDYKKVVTTDGKANKKTTTKTETKATKTKATKTTKANKKTEPKPEPKAEPQTDRIADLEKQIAELTKAVKVLAQAAKDEPKATPKLEAKRVATDNSNSNAPKCKYILTVNGKVVRK